MHLVSPLAPVLFPPRCFRYWDVVQRHKVTQFYTAPTAIRALMSFGPEIIEGYDLSSLRVLGSVGEPINPEAWRWYNEHVRPGVRWAGGNWGVPSGYQDGPARRHSRLFWTKGALPAHKGLRVVYCGSLEFASMMLTNSVPRLSCFRRRPFS